jgi:hypothetical protein
MMKVCLDPIKLLKEGKITQFECERIRSLSSKWNSPFIPCVPIAFAIIYSTMWIIWPLAVFSPLLILLGVFVLGLAGGATKLLDRINTILLKFLQ